MNRKAEMTTKEILELILAAAGIFLLLILLWKLISPAWDKDSETAKSYLNTLKKEIAKADAGGIGEFEMWHTEKPDRNTKFMLVYFGSDLGQGLKYNNWPWKIASVSGNYESRMFFDFVSPGFKPNQLCICYGKGLYSVAAVNGKELDLSGILKPNYAKCDQCITLDAKFIAPDEYNTGGVLLEDLNSYSVYLRPIFIAGEKLYIKKYYEASIKYVFVKDPSVFPITREISEFDEEGLGEAHPEFVCKEVFDPNNPPENLGQEPTSFRYMGAWELTTGDVLTPDAKWVSMAKNSIFNKHDSFSEIFMNSQKGADIMESGGLSTISSKMGEELYKVRLNFEKGKKLLMDSPNFQCPGQKIEFPNPIGGIKDSNILPKFLALNVFVLRDQEVLKTNPELLDFVMVREDRASVEAHVKEYGGDHTEIIEKGTVEKYITEELFNNCELDGLNQDLFFKERTIKQVSRDETTDKIVEEEYKYYQIDFILRGMVLDAEERVLDYPVRNALLNSDEEPIIYFLISKNDKFFNAWSGSQPKLIKFEDLSGYESPIKKKKLCDGDFELYVVHRGTKK